MVLLNIYNVVCMWFVLLCPTTLVFMVPDEPKIDAYEMQKIREGRGNHPLTQVILGEKGLTKINVSLGTHDTVQCFI
jgi:hypothetical protein